MSRNLRKKNVTIWASRKARAPKTPVAYTVGQTEISSPCLQFFDPLHEVREPDTQSVGGGVSQPSLGHLVQEERGAQIIHCTCDCQFPLQPQLQLCQRP